MRAVLVDDALYPGFTRVIWKAHVREMTDLPRHEREALMEAVWCVERTQRSVLHAEKINLASFGNVVPHVHWHVIPRFRDDAHFPQPIWAAVNLERNASAATEARRASIALYLERLGANLRIL